VIYSYDITTPKNTSNYSPQRTALKVTKGLVYQVEVEFPPGPLGLCHVAIFDGGFQVWPSNPEQSFHGDNGYMTFGDSYLKLTEPYEFTAVTWNNDDTYQHTIHVRLGMVSDEVFMARYLPSLSYDKMLETLALVQVQQEERQAALLANPIPWKVD